MKDRIVTITLDAPQYTKLIEALQIGAGTCDILKSQTNLKADEANSAHWREVYRTAADKWQEQEELVAGAGRMIKNNMRWEEVE